jgi:uncharacterized membrane protein YfhO
LLLVLLLLREFLWQQEWIISTNEGGDVFVQFYAWRQFAANHLLAGEFPFWNPHIFGGIPFFGGMQSALLYPLNALFLFLPTTVAINWSIALHLWLMGLFTTLWLRHGLKLSHGAAGMGGVMVMFSGPFFMHIHGGQLTNLSVMIWVPLLLLAIDRWFAGRGRGWLAVGAMAVAMQILAGHPQYLYYTGITVLLYGAMYLLHNRENRLRNASAIFIIYLTGALLGAVQLLAGFEAAMSSVRGGGISTEFAGEGSFPPAYIVTLIAPHLLDLADDKAWLWETTLFFGVIGLCLTIIGARYRTEARTKGFVILIALLMVLALGRYTPLFPLLMKYLPGFDLFRGTTKFAFFAILFSVSLASLGIDRLYYSDRGECKQFVPHMVLAAIGLVIALLALSVMTNDSTSNVLLAHPEGGKTLSTDLLIAVALLTLGALLLWARHRGSKHALTLLLGLLALELYMNAATHLPRFKESEILNHPIVEWMHAHPDDGRVLSLDYRNATMVSGGYELWGNDPGVNKRWAEFVAATQGMPPLENQNFYFSRLVPQLAIARLQWHLHATADGVNATKAGSEPFSRALLFHSVEAASEGALLKRLTDPSLDFRHTLLVEEPIPIQPNPAGNGTVTIISNSINALELTAETSTPAVLLITDAYDKGWCAKSLDKNNLRDYRVIPADHAFIGIPLEAGEHHILLEYRPRTLTAGLLLSALGLLLLAALLWPGRLAGRKWLHFKLSL